MTTSSENPASKYLGTTWQKIEGRFLLGTSGSGASKQTGGSNQKTITQANLPNIKLAVNSFSLSKGSMDITGSFESRGRNTRDDNVAYEVDGAFSCQKTKTGQYFWNSTDNDPVYKYSFQASKAWTGSTNSVSPQTNSLGSGQAFDITPSYYTCHMWLRIS